MRETWIYALVDPRDSRIRYIGKADNPHKRLLAHIGEAKKVPKMLNNPLTIIRPRYTWIHSLLLEGLQPIVVGIEKCPAENWREVENRWIFKLKEAGADLTNVKTIAGHPNFHNELYFPKREREPVKILGRFKIIKIQE